MNGRVLIVDDDKAVRTVLQVHLSKHGLHTTLASAPEEALEALRTSAFDLVITDVMMPGISGIQLLQKVRQTWPDTQVVVMTGFGSVTDAVSAMKQGASDYLIKPVGREQLLLVVDRALEQRSMRVQLAQLKAEVDERYGFERLIGIAPAMKALYEEVTAVADSSATVLIEGQTGTGKELISAAIHHRSRRKNAPFVRLNCAAIPESLLESELFGHEKGAFTGAIRQHQGKFEQADGGTLLLDEIGEINAYTQVKLLRVLENGEFQRVGGSETLQVDVRVIAATNKDLHTEAKEGRFRKDLFFRLNVVRLKVPALHQRREDIPLLVEHFLEKFAHANERPVPEISDEAMEQLMQAPWPGNVRQLEHVIERAVVLCKDHRITRVTMPDAGGMDDEPTLLPPVGTTLQQALMAHERRILVAALKEAKGVQAHAAKRLGVSRSNLNYRIQRLDIRVKEVAYD